MTWTTTDGRCYFAKTVCTNNLNKVGYSKLILTNILFPAGCMSLHRIISCLILFCTLFCNMDMNKYYVSSYPFKIDNQIITKYSYTVLQILDVEMTVIEIQVQFKTCKLASKVF